MTARTRASVEVVSECRNILGESPVWSAREEALYWTDIREPALYRIDLKSGSTRRWPMPELAGAVVLRRRGGVVVGLKSGLYAFDVDAGALEPIYTFENGHPDDRTNDSRCDRQGRLWFSRMRDYGRAQTGAVYRMDQDLQPISMISELSVPNAICFSPEGDRTYFADTPTGEVEILGIDAEDGKLQKRRLLLSADVAPGKPDGATVDAEGYVWNARFGGGCLVRCAPDGKVDAIIELPISHPTSCCFGGKNLDRLYVTTATQGLDPVSLTGEPLAGALLVIEPGVIGLEEPAFCG
jgi:sugar lactone lactonase YvrE